MSAASSGTSGRGKGTICCRLVLLFRISRLDLRIPVMALLGTLDGIGRDQRIFEPAGRDGDDHALAPGQHQRLVTAEGEQALLLAAS